MTIHKIENMTFSELKKKQAELAESLAGELPQELATRYLQARTDAKQRDEKLAEQGKTITSLNEGHEFLTGRVAELELQITLKDDAIAIRSRELEFARQAHSNEVAALTQAHSDVVNALNDEISELKNSLLRQTQRAVRLKVQAIVNQTALTGAAKLLNDAISARQIEDADTGE